MQVYVCKYLYYYKVKSVLCIGSAHNNVRTSNVNIAQIPNVSNFFEPINSISYSFRSIANQNCIRYSDSTSYFKKYSSSNVNKPFVYITDLTLGNPLLVGSSTVIPCPSSAKVHFSVDLSSLKVK